MGVDEDSAALARLMGEIKETGRRAAERGE
jgi:hypothetical protein